MMKAQCCVTCPVVKIVCQLTLDLRYTAFWNDGMHHVRLHVSHIEFVHHNKPLRLLLAVLIGQHERPKKSIN